MVVFPKSLRDLSHQFLDAPDVSDLMALMANALIPYGCDYFIFGGSSSSKFGTLLQDQGVNFCLSNLPAAFLRRNPNPMLNNITVRRVLQQGQDSLWTDPNIWQDATPVEIALRTEFQAAGLTRGYTGGLSRQPGYYTGIGFHLGRLSKTDFARDWDQIRPELMAIAGIFDQVFLNNHISTHFSLSPRERDVLSWLAMGLRPDEIAHRLGIGAGTVDKYIVSAKEKLSARTRDHAVARALMLGLIKL